MQFTRAITGEVIALEKARVLGGGGEGQVYGLDSALAAKLYRTPTDGRKLRAMLANPPAEAGQAGQIAIAWPLDLLVDSRGEVCGFLMPRVTAARPIVNFYNPRARLEQCPLFNYRYLHRAARNLAAAFQRLHERGYVIGDVNESNILATDTALVTLVDTDSFQVRDGEITYRCRVGRPEFTPPELQGSNLAEVDRTPEHDRFGLAVLLFQLLMEGTHPFAGVFEGEGEPPALSQRIGKNWFPYGGASCPIRPSPFSPPFALLPPDLQKLFLRCFLDGHAEPAIRPDAKTWQQALEAAEAALVVCPANPQHLYGEHLQTCPWCARTQRLKGRDPFPAEPPPLSPRPAPVAPSRSPAPAPLKRKTNPLLKPLAAFALATLVVGYFVFDSLGFWAPSFSGYIDSIVFSPDSKAVAVPTADGVALHDTHSGEWLKSLPGTDAYPVGFSRDGKALLIFNENGRELNSWDLTRGKLKATSHSEIPAFLSKRTSPDGRYSFDTEIVEKNASEFEEKLWLIDAKTGKHIRELNGIYQQANVLGFGNDNKTLLIGKYGTKNVVEVRDIKTDALLRSFGISAYGIFAMDISWDGKFVATCGFDRFIKLWDATTGKQIWSFWLGEHVNALQFSPDSSVLAAEVKDGASARIKLLKVR